MKTVFISFYEAYPPTSGAAVVTYNCARYADGQGVLIQMGKADSDEITADDVRVITFRGADSRLRKLCLMYGLTGKIVSACRQIAPDLIVLEGASWALYHWMLLRRLRAAGMSASIVYHSHNVEYILRREKHGRVVTAITKWAEGRLLQQSDQAFAVSDIDASHFEELYGVDPDLLPNGVDVDRFAGVTEDAAEAIRKKYRLNNETTLFMGFYSYKPNREAIDFLVESVFPRVIEKRGGAKLVVIGEKIPYSKSWLINPGSIPHEDVPLFVKACRVGLAPIFSGSGTRLKILEYLAAGLPVVSTEKGAEGLSLHDGADIAIARGVGEFVDQIIKALDEKDDGTLAAKRQAAVRDKYSWQKIMSEFYEAVESGRQAK